MMSPLSAGRSTDLGFALLLGDPLDRPVDILVGHLDDEPLDLEIGKARLRDIRQHLERHLVFEIGPFAERDDVDLRRQRRAQIVLAYRLGRSCPATVLSSTSPRTECRSAGAGSASGPCPDGSPRSWIVRPISPSRLVTFSSSSPAGTTTRNSRFSPSALVSVTCMKEGLWFPKQLRQRRGAGGGI